MVSAVTGHQLMAKPIALRVTADRFAREAFPGKTAIGPWPGIDTLAHAFFVSDLLTALLGAGAIPPAAAGIGDMSGEPRADAVHCPDSVVMRPVADRVVRSLTRTPRAGVGALATATSGPDSSASVTCIGDANVATRGDARTWPTNCSSTTGRSPGLPASRGPGQNRAPARSSRCLLPVQNVTVADDSRDSKLLHIPDVSGPSSSLGPRAAFICSAQRSAQDSRSRRKHRHAPVLRRRDARPDAVRPHQQLRSTLTGRLIGDGLLMKSD